MCIQAALIITHQLDAIVKTNQQKCLRNAAHRMPHPVCSRSALPVHLPRFACRVASFGVFLTILGKKNARGDIGEMAWREQAATLCCC